MECVECHHGVERWREDQGTIQPPPQYPIHGTNSPLDKAEQKLLLDKKQKFAKALEEQRNEIKRRQGDASEEKQKQLAKIQSDTGLFENDKLAAKVQKVQSHAKEKALIEAQIDARKQLRERERQAKIESEQRDVARAKRMAVEEEELRLKKKEEGTN